MRRQLGSGIAVVAVACVAAGARAETPYDINLTRPIEPGQRLHIVAEATIDVSTTADMGDGPKEIGSVKMKVKLNSIAQVMKVDEHGRPTAMAHTIKECIMIRGGRPSMIVPPGDTLVARQRSGKMTFFAKKRRFNMLQQMALEAVAELDIYGATEDELFGSSRPRRVGEHWPINAEALAAELGRLAHRKSRAEDIRGTTSLVRVQGFNDQPCQMIGITIDARGVIPGIDQLPPSARLKSSRMQVQHFKMLPMDESKHGLADNTTIEVEILFSDSLGSQAAEGRIALHFETSHRYEPVPDRTAAAPDR